jgi:hypothetical protein
MARRTQVLRFPFADGQHEEADARMLPDGLLSRARNLRMRKSGTLGVRYDFTALARDTHVGANLEAVDVYTVRERLFALGYPTGAGALSDVFEYNPSGDPFTWRGTAQEASRYWPFPLTDVRDMGVLPPRSVSVTRLDVAAAGGLVCCAFEVNGDTVVHVFEASTNATRLLETVTGMTRPRAVVSGDVFFVVGLTDTATDVSIRRFNPASDTALATVTGITGATTITAWDLAPEETGGGFVIAVATSAPTVSLYRRSSTGAAVQTITGAAVATSHLAVHSDGATRVSYVSVLTSGATLTLRSYLISGGTSENGPTTLFSSGTTTAQPGIARVSSTTLAVYAAVPADTVAVDQRVIATHVAGTQRTFVGAVLATKPVNPLSSTAVELHGCGVTIADDVDACQLTHYWACPAVPSLGAVKNRFIAGNPDTSHLPGVGYDAESGRFYWPQLTVDLDERCSPLVSEIAYNEIGRRPAAVVGGNLYISGATALGFDGRYAWESGFIERPHLTAITPSNGAGALPTDQVLTIAVTFEWYDSDGFYHTSMPSAFCEVTMGVGEDTLTVAGVAPHTIRSNAIPGSVKVVGWRTRSQRKQLQRCEVVAANFGAAFSLVMLLSDEDIETNAIIYTQGGRGGLSGPMQHEHADPGGHLWPLGQRIINTRLPARRKAQVSKLLFPGEPVQWSGEASHYVEAKDDIVAGGALDGRGYLFCRQSISAFGGDGPNDINEGEFSLAIELPTGYGLYNEHSLLETPDGLLFQADRATICLLPRGGGAPVPVAGAVEDTLDAYPVITAAVLHREEQVAVFCCNNEAGTDAVLLSYDLQVRCWTVDDFPTPTPIAAACEYDGRLAIVSNGVVLLQNRAHPGAVFLPHGMKTGVLAPFKGAWGKFVSFYVLGTAKGECFLTARISYDEGVSWTDLHKFHLRASDVGKAVRRRWSPRRRKVDRLMLEWAVTGVGSTASEGFAFHEFGIEVVPSSGAPRLGAGKNG